MKPTPKPFAVGDSVLFRAGGSLIAGTIKEIRSDNKAIVVREGRPDITRSLAFLERPPVTP